MTKWYIVIWCPYTISYSFILIFNSIDGMDSMAYDNDLRKLLSNLYQSAFPTDFDRLEMIRDKYQTVLYDFNGIE